MLITEATFIKSAAEPAGWPGPDLPELAFCGRSNVGKSTLLNHLLKRKGLARVSSTPGRTRLVNFFRCDGLRGPDRRPASIMVADLPGFGYAQVSKSERATWRPLIEGYLTRRDSLAAVVLLCDSRRAADLTKKDADLALLQEEEDLCAWLQQIGRRVIPVMTKADKLAKHERKPALFALQRRLMIAPVAFSGLSGEGTEDLWRRIDAALFPPPLVADPG